MDDPVTLLRSFFATGPLPANLRAVLATLDGAAAREAVLAETLSEHHRFRVELRGDLFLMACSECGKANEAHKDGCSIGALLSNPTPAAEALLSRLAAAERERDRLQAIADAAREYIAATEEYRKTSDPAALELARTRRERLKARVAELEKNDGR